MPGEYLTDGDNGFVGLNSRDNPSSLPAGYLSQSINMRLDRGVATARKGLYKYSDAQIIGKEVIASGVYIDANGQEILVLLVNEPSPSANNTQIYTYNATSNTFSSAKTMPVRIPSSEGVSVVYALGKIFITRGHNERPVMWDLLNTFTIMPTGGGSGNQFPNCTALYYYMNRLVALGRYHGSNDPLEARYTVSVSNFLEWQNWDALDAFVINQGGNDETVGIVPWTVNEFLILMRNSAFYLNVGTARHIGGDALPVDAALFTLSTDVGCVARKTALQVMNGVMFLSDNGVYFLQPNPSGNEGVKLLTLGEPVSAPINDVIQRINRDFAKDAVAAYWNNRYYLAVPLDNSTKNNAVLVYNFILKAWESVDEYPNGVDFSDFWVLKKDKQRRLYAVDSTEGILLLEEGLADYLGQGTGTPVLPFILDNTAILTGFGSFQPTPIQASIVTRRYNFNDPREKRFSSVEADIDCTNGGTIDISLITLNPDTTTLLDTFTSTVAEDTTRRPAARKIAYGAQVRYRTFNQNPSIRTSHVRATALGKTNISIV